MRVIHMSIENRNCGLLKIYEANNFHANARNGHRIERTVIAVVIAFVYVILLGIVVSYLQSGHPTIMALDNVEKNYADSKINFERNVGWSIHGKDFEDDVMNNNSREIHSLK